MDRRDYILRLIEQFGQFAIALRKLIVGGSAGTAGVTDQLRSVAQHAGLDLDIARVATADTLVLLVAPGGELEPGRCWMCAETLYLDALDAELSHDIDRAYASYMKARMLFSMVAPLGAFLVGFPEAGERIAEIDGRVAALPGEAEGGPPSGRARPRRSRIRQAALRGGMIP